MSTGNWQFLAIERRPAIVTRNFAISAGHPLAAAAGLAIYLRGGNYVDAAIAASAVLCVVRPHMTGLGGDIFMMIKTANSPEIYILEGVGRSPAGLSANRLRKEGYNEMPERGPISMTVPGIVDGWARALRRFGRTDMAVVLGYAAEFAEGGFPVSEKLAHAISANRELLKRDRHLADVFLPKGKPLQAGEILIQKSLARSLKKIMEEGSDAFYKGTLAGEIISSLRKKGCMLKEDDFSEHESLWRKPLSINFYGHKVHTAPPPSQGMALLMQLKLLELLDISDSSPFSAEYFDKQLRAREAAFIERDKYVADPAFCSVPVGELLSEEFLRRRASEIASVIGPIRIRTLGSIKGQGGDTDTVIAADGDGNGVCLIQSIYLPFGSGVMAGDTGILMHNRGACFNLIQGHPNELAPRKKPYHTLSPSIVTSPTGEVRYLLATPGADGQTQTLSQVLTLLLSHGVPLRRAVESPRWRAYPDGKVEIEERIDDGVLEDLKGAGYKVERVSPWHESMGSVTAIKIVDRWLEPYADSRREAYHIGI